MAERRGKLRGNCVVKSTLVELYNDGETEDVWIEVWEERSDLLDRTSIG